MKMIEIYHAFVNFLLQLERNYDATIAAGSDKSTASTRTTLETFGRVTRIGCTWMFLEAPCPLGETPTLPSLRNKFRPWGRSRRLWGSSWRLCDNSRRLIVKGSPVWRLLRERCNSSWPSLWWVNKAPGNLATWATTVLTGTMRLRWDYVIWLWLILLVFWLLFVIIIHVEIIWTLMRLVFGYYSIWWDCIWLLFYLIDVWLRLMLV